ncbi:MAG TPA: sulfite exporter TauE/SafE family protein [Candidatus Krumholzibacteria bacterium]|nr:sulfite exporter TauE/SafE family protein [Candidatus Krumholzibacteria bacterium]
MDKLTTFIIVGFLAQLIDGTMGMAYGVSATTFLLFLGVPPAVASASVHAAKMATTLISGVAHYRFGNVRIHLVKRLVISGVLGAGLGAWVLGNTESDIIKPVVAAYLLLMGVFILLKARGHVPGQDDIRTHIIPLGFGGGFLDAVGGGGWGPIVTSTLLARGNHPRFTIGSVNLAEFFVSVAASTTFILTIGLSYWTAIAGLAIGGVVAAPLAAYLCKHVPTRALMYFVGALIMALSLRTLLTFLL